MDKVLKNKTRVGHPKLLSLTYGHGQSLKNSSKSKTPKAFFIDALTWRNFKNV